jgi:hypothetical protein
MKHLKYVTETLAKVLENHYKQTQYQDKILAKYV